jgi:hypothetical protein
LPIDSTHLSAVRAFARIAAAAVIFLTLLSRTSLAQPPQLVFTAPLPDETSHAADIRLSPVVEERGLALWAGSATDFGAGVTLPSARWAVRGVSAMTTSRIDDRERPAFYQFELLHPVFSSGSFSIAAGGGVREEWDGRRVFLGRVIGGSDLAHGRLQGSLVVERAASSAVAHDAADFLTTIGWARAVGRGISFGVEGVGQDLEGLWNPAEADGGAKLLVGPSLHAQSARGTWSASLTVGPVVQTYSTAAPAPTGGYHLAVFAAGTWIPAAHH